MDHSACLCILQDVICSYEVGAVMAFFLCTFLFRWLIIHAVLPIDLHFYLSFGFTVLPRGKSLSLSWWIEV